jgi:hypothetical protein
MSKWEEWKKNLGETRPWHLLDHSKLVEDESISDARYEICKACPELIKATKTCKKCGCFMAAKTKLELAVCPIGKW